MHTTVKTLLLAAVALPLIGIGATNAADAPKNQPGTAAQSQGAAPKKVSTADYVTKAASGDMFEVESSKLAAQKATNEKVKDFAEKMVKDHNKSTEKLKEAADKGKAQHAAHDMAPHHKEALEKLRSASGAEFDRMYLAEQMKAHREAHELHDGYAKTGDNAELKKAAGDIAKTVQAHMKQLDEITKETSRKGNDNRNTPANRSPNKS